MKKITRQILAAFLALFCLGLAGCIESEETYILNPDGSGKVERLIIFEPVDFFRTDQARPDKEQELRDAVLEELQKTQGILAWRNIEYEWTDDERIRLRATGYFRDFNEVAFHNGGVEGDFFVTELKLEEPNRIRISMQPDTEDGQGLLSSSEDGPVTEENVAERVRSERAEFRRARPFMAALLQSYKTTVKIQLPGEAIEVSGFETAGGELSATLSGRSFLDGMEAVMADEEQHRELLLMDEAAQAAKINRFFTGTEGPFSALFAVETDQFDFEAELAEAQEEYAAVLAELGAAPVARVTESPEAFEKLERIVLGGLRWIPEEPGSIRGVRPLNHDPGLTLAMLAEFPKPVTEVSEIRIHRAVTPAGEDLLKGRRRGSGPLTVTLFSQNLSDDRQALRFEVRLDAPEEPVETIAELSGVLVCRASLGVTEDDLGFDRLAIGEEGSLFNARLAEAQFGWGQENEFTLELRIDPAEIAEVKFVDPEGNELEVDRRGHMTSGRNVNFTYGSEQPLPEETRIVLVRHSGLQEFEVPFELKDVSLVPGRR